LLVESGLWLVFRARPYGKVPSPREACAGIFVTATETNPGSLDVDVAYAGHAEDFRVGLAGLAKMAKVYLCTHSGSAVSAQGVENVVTAQFDGLHPAGLAGTHIHTLLGVGRHRSAWHLGFQDVIAAGHMIRTGTHWLDRVVALSGPMVRRPRLLRTRLGASVDQLVAGELGEGELRVISGSALHGHVAMGDETGYLGRYSQQITALAEGRERFLAGWLMPGTNKFSVIPAYISALMKGQKFAFNTNTEGSHRAMVPIGAFEKVMPLDIMPTFLLRSLAVGDLERAEQLGCMELIEEDLALCSFVAPGKEDFGAKLRELLTTMWKEG
jgi:Na+-transporting NADH:ubiquinone oxidoreductase subunit A